MQYLELDRNFDALSAWRNATFLKPTHKIAWSNLIVMLDSMGKIKFLYFNLRNTRKFIFIDIKLIKIILTKFLKILLFE